MTDGWWCTLCICMLQDCLQNVIAVCVKPGVSRVLPEKCPPRQGNNLKREPCEAVQALWVAPNMCKHCWATAGHSWRAPMSGVPDRIGCRWGQTPY